INQIGKNGFFSTVSAFQLFLLAVTLRDVVGKSVKFWRFMFPEVWTTVLHHTDNWCVGRSTH
ncbi:hypothetical protein CMV_019709, partial [Castanea mollissima]